MNREASTDYQAVNRVGRIVKTFSDIEIGRAWVRENSSFYGRLELLEVETVVTTRRVYRPRPKPVQSLAISRPVEPRLTA
ncbi:hypothetical protein [Brevundimonas olei]|uniref:hypothetical protein n=1 Tax=Brevundimonas olei TaxID=657642 RepID=UPI0031DE8282